MRIAVNVGVLDAPGVGSAETSFASVARKLEFANVWETSGMTPTPKRHSLVPGHTASRIRPMLAHGYRRCPRCGLSRARPALRRASPL